MPFPCERVLEEGGFRHIPKKVKDALEPSGQGVFRNQKGI